MTRISDYRAETGLAHRSIDKMEQKMKSEHFSWKKGLKEKKGSDPKYAKYDPFLQLTC